MKKMILAFIGTCLMSTAFAATESLPTATVAKLQDSLEIYANEVSSEEYQKGQSGYAVFFSRNEPFTQLSANVYAAKAFFTFRDDDGMGSELAFDVVLTCENEFRSCTVEAEESQIYTEDTRVEILSLAFAKYPVIELENLLSLPSLETGAQTDFGTILTLEEFSCSDFQNSFTCNISYNYQYAQNERKPVYKHVTVKGVLRPKLEVKSVKF